MTAFAESVVEEAALAWLEALGYAVLHGPGIAVGEPGAERADPNYRDVILERRRAPLPTRWTGRHTFATSRDARPWRNGFAIPPIRSES